MDNVHKYTVFFFRLPQSESFLCTEMRKLVEVKGEYNLIFTQNIPSELVKTAHSIYNLREELRKLG